MTSVVTFLAAKMQIINENDTLLLKRRRFFKEMAYLKVKKKHFSAYNKSALFSNQLMNEDFNG